MPSPSPFGTESCGTPARFGPTVRASMAYVSDADISCASSKVGATPGIDGAASRSQRSKTCSIWLISLRLTLAART